MHQYATCRCAWRLALNSSASTNGEFSRVARHRRAKGYLPETSAPLRMIPLRRGASYFLTAPSFCSAAKSGEAADLPLPSENRSDDYDRQAKRPEHDENLPVAMIPVHVAADTPPSCGPSDRVRLTGDSLQSPVIEGRMSACGRGGIPRARRAERPLD
jgi:hypothetical protein